MSKLLFAETPMVSLANNLKETFEILNIDPDKHSIAIFEDPSTDGLILQIGQFYFLGQGQFRRLVSNPDDPQTLIMEKTIINKGLIINRVKLKKYEIEESRINDELQDN